MCRSEPSLSHDYHVTEGHVSSKVCRSPRQSLTPRALSATREGRELETTAGNSSCDKAEERTEHARYQLEIHLTATLCYDFKGNYKVCRSTVFVSQLSSTVARKCKLRLGEEGIRSRIPVSSLIRPARCQCLTYKPAKLQRSSMQSRRTQMHYPQRWQTHLNSFN